ncbi:glutamate--tRNA ligase [Mycoplasma phocoenae]|uniref:Glutamate--tRNA ligase n=1 Tax=Mycoplasma phocoenae TaxID=754517 RepID=A0A858U6P9_9MOLU|nr:glutamate--tRNA ligase [Mycoplasma phocoenae]QJG66903.1 glutamate--tRNA ligase [Mycoplasma phocoenae]
MKKIRTRYAPSPTGYLHIGGARTALFNYLFAKHFGGDFVLRIEDTDIARNVVGGEDSQLNNLAWLGIIPDESPKNPKEKYGPYRQSEKLAIYDKIIDELIEKKLAYKAYDTTEELAQQHDESEKAGIASFRYNRNWLQITEEEKQKRDAAGEYSVRLALPKNHNYTWNDLVRGTITVNSDDVGDYVIRKSDGYPTYNFAVVVDDHQMEITHVLRGEEHTTNTPKQLAVYEAMGWDAPEFGHLTIITNMEGKKLSKRDTSLKQFIEDYKNEGYNSEAIFNFLSLLGWTSADAKEVMSKEELIQKFEYERLSKSPSKFDIQKMEWFSKQYWKNIEPEDIFNKISARDLEWAKDKIENKEWMNIFIQTYQQNMVTFNDLIESLKMYAQPSMILDIEYQSNDVIKSFYENLKDKEFTIDNIQFAIDETKNQLNVKGKNLFMPIRIATTFKEHGPELAKAIFLFGQSVVFERIKQWI